MNGVDAMITTGTFFARAALDPRARLVATSLLGVVFILSGIPKVRRPDLAAMAFVDFGLVRTVRTQFGVLLGATECLLGVALLTSIAAPLPTALSVVALWTFTVLLARTLRSGRAISCFCFGGSDLISTRTVVRTLGLAVMSSAVMLLPSPVAGIADLVLAAVFAACMLGSVALFGATFSTFRGSQVSDGTARP